MGHVISWSKYSLKPVLSFFIAKKEMVPGNGLEDEADPFFMAGREFRYFKIMLAAIGVVFLHL